MPAGSNPAKVAATRAYGAEVVTAGVTGDNRETFAADLAADRGLRLVHPFDDHDVMAGQGTAALELLDDVGDLDLVLVPVGGGGLIAGPPPSRAAPRRPGRRGRAGRRRRRPGVAAGRAAHPPARRPGHHRRRRPQPVRGGAAVRGHPPPGRRHRHRHRRRAARRPRPVLVADQAAGRADRRPAPGRPAHRRRRGDRVGVVLTGGNVDAAALAACLASLAAASRAPHGATPGDADRRPGGRAGSWAPTWRCSWSAGWSGWRRGRSPAGGCSPTPARPGSRASRR